YRGRPLQDVQYRSRNKRALSAKAKISWVYQHGADIQAKDHEKLWLCMRCHLQKDYDSQLLNAKSTSSIASHLRKVHGITETGKIDGSAAQTSRKSLARRGLLPPPFNDYEYKKD